MSDTIDWSTGGVGDADAKILRLPPVKPAEFDPEAAEDLARIDKEEFDQRVQASYEKWSPNPNFDPPALGDDDAPWVGQVNGKEAAKGETSESWRPVDLGPVLAGEVATPAPTMMLRTDGVPLVYAGKLHAFNAESEAGKTMLACHLCGERIQAGEHVFYFDFESDAPTIVERLQLLGLTAEQILGQFHYWRPDEPFGLDELEAIQADLATYNPTVIVFDGVTEAMGLHDLSIKDNDDIARFIKRLPRPLVREGAAGILLDHLGRDVESRRGHAIGGQHKKAGVDVTYELTVVTRFGRGVDGEVALKVTKDRPGHVRPRSTGREMAGRILIRSDDDARLAVTIEPHPDKATPTGPFRPTGYMEKVSAWLAAQRDPASGRAIQTGVGGKKEYVEAATARLVEENYVNRERVGSAYRHRLIRPYTEHNDPLLKEDEGEPE